MINMLPAPQVPAFPLVASQRSKNSPGSRNGHARNKIFQEFQGRSSSHNLAARRNHALLLCVTRFPQALIICARLGCPGLKVHERGNWSEECQRSWKYNATRFCIAGDS